MVVGDAMIDAYMWGNIYRQSPEAPVPVVEVSKQEKRLGGAANVAKNIQSLGATPLLCAVVGQDDKGFLELMKKEGLNTSGILQEERKTTIKTRIISEQQHQLRVDEEDSFPIQKEEAFIESCLSLLKDIDVLIFQDYNKGVLTPKVIESLIQAAKKHNIPTVVDPKKDNYWAYKGVTLFKPNLKELNEGGDTHLKGSDTEGISTAVQLQRSKLQAEQFLLTLSEHGVFHQDDKGNTELAAYPRKIVDVSGAGDSVISTAALALAAGCEAKELTILANLAGGLVCEAPGVVSIEKDSLFQEANRLA
jgi:rfaE bifunctional protein kinase chain/domain